MPNDRRLATDPCRRPVFTSATLRRNAHNFQAPHIIIAIIIIITCAYTCVWMCVYVAIEKWRRRSGARIIIIIIYSRYVEKPMAPFHPAPTTPPRVSLLHRSFRVNSRKCIRLGCNNNNSLGSSGRKLQTRMHLSCSCTLHSPP